MQSSSSEMLLPCCSHRTEPQGDVRLKMMRVVGHSLVRQQWQEMAQQPRRAGFQPRYFLRLVATWWQVL